MRKVEDFSESTEWKTESSGDLDDTVEPTAEVEVVEEKPKRSYKKKDPIALKSCTVRFENADVVLVEGQPIPGLRSQERKYLTAHGFIK
jgi:hypothetical protein